MPREKSDTARQKFGADESWTPARLIPTSGIRGQEEQEKRATSSLLAVIAAVPEFGKALLKDIGAPGGRISTYAEVQLKDDDGKVSIPDGAIVVERGTKSWVCLVEVKTGEAELKAEQVSRYLDLARVQGFDAVLTISNQIRRAADDHLVVIDGRKLRNTQLRHMSWWRILTNAIVEYRHRGISDPDQAWILGELIAYLSHESSGASGFHDMGDKWVRVRDAVRHDMVRASDPDVLDVASKWQQYVEFLCLGLSQELGRDISTSRKRKQSPDAQRDELAKILADSGKMYAELRVPDAAGPIGIEVDLRTRYVNASVTVEAPREGRPKTRVNWLLRQLHRAPNDLQIEVSYKNSRESHSEMLAEVIEYPQRLLCPTETSREPRVFRLALAKSMGIKRGRGRGSFVGDTRHQVLDFYRDLVQDLRAWQPPAPKLPEESSDADTTDEHPA